MTSSASTNSPSELFIPSHELASTSGLFVPSLLTPFTPPAKMIPLKILPTSVTQVITTTKTLRRCCGFSLAIVGFLFYCLRSLVALWWIVFYLVSTEKSKRDSSIALLLEASACSVGITKFLRIMRNPKITLKESNLKNVWMFALIPIFSFGKSIFASRPSFILPAIEFLFYSGYIYGLSLNGRSSSMWAGFKPFRYAMVPLILPIPPSSRAFPQYTLPPTTKISV